MKSVFDIMLIVFVTLTMFVCMMFFAEEIGVQQQAIHLRNRINEILEINGGYTNEAKTELDSLIDNLSRTTTVEFSKTGKLNYGEKIIFEIVIFYKRKLPFYQDSTTVRYGIEGEYYNINTD